MTLEILMPFWGRFDHFQEAVESVLAQDDPDWRLIIVDDVYPDPAPGVWAQAIGDRRVTYVRNTTNLRPSRNYNKCVSMAREEYVVLMGCDDVMGPGYVRRVHELLREFPDADIVQPGVSIIDDRSRPCRPLGDRVKARLAPKGARPIAARGEPLAVSLLRGNWTYFPSLTWRRSWLAGREFRVDLDVVQDIEMIAHIVVAGGVVVLDDKDVFQYRRHRTSVSALTGPDGVKFAQERMAFAEIAAMCEEIGWRRAARAARRHLTSRIHALTELPSAVRARKGAGFRALVGHAFGRSGR